MQNLSFTEKVLKVVSNIPKGKVMTYGQVAKKAGAEGASRAVGSIMSKNQNDKIPCHRVVKANGEIGNYNGLQTKNKKTFEEYEASMAKMELLKEEGVNFTKNNKIIF